MTIQPSFTQWVLENAQHSVDEPVEFTMDTLDEFLWAFGDEFKLKEPVNEGMFDNHSTDTITNTDIAKGTGAGTLTWLYATGLLGPAIAVTLSAGAICGVARYAKYMASAKKFLASYRKMSLEKVRFMNEYADVLDNYVIEDEIKKYKTQMSEMNEAIKLEKARASNYNISHA